jgi:hypothetical protein
MLKALGKTNLLLAKFSRTTKSSQIYKDSIYLNVQRQYKGNV